MGLAASQATLLQITSRIHDVEYEAQQIQHAKLRLALQEDEISQKYLDALDEETLTVPWGSEGKRIAATFDNICGLGSLQLAKSNKHHVFYDKDNHLIVPTEVYSGYLNYGGGDPYEFAMFMMGVDLNEKVNPNEESSITKFEDAKNSLGIDIWSDFVKKNQSTIDQIYGMTSTGKADTDGSQKAAWITGTDDGANEGDFKNAITGGTFESFLKNCFPWDSENNRSLLSEKDQNNLKNLFDDLQAEYKNEYEFKLYKQNNGAAKIYEKLGLGDAENFDRDLFDYYLRWGQLIERQGGIDTDGDLTGCISASAYGQNVEDNAGLLNQMILNGLISIDIVYDNGKNGISLTPTSTSTDTVLTFEKTANIDSTKSKKLEAERDRELKKLNAQDKKYDLSLNKLETERNALDKMYESVKKVAEENIDRTFGIFS